jgi:hypothetical protein
MDRELFDRLSRLVAAGTRRDALRLLLSGAVAGMAAGGEGAAAKNKNKHKHKRRNKKRRRSRAGEPGTPGERGTAPTPGTAGALPVGAVCPNTCTTTCADQPIQAGANLAGCDFTERDLQGANLAGANLDRACLGNATLRDVSFRGANLGQSCLCGADLAGADFRGANVTAKQLACATVTCATTLPDGTPAAPCARGLTCCNNLCVPINADPGNCGACGNVCTPPAICENGRCRVLPGTGTCLPPDADLQAAINATGGGAVQTPTLTLCEGRFSAVELVVSLDNAPAGINIVGAGRDKTILDGQGQGFVIKVQGGGPNSSLAFLNLTGVTVTGSGGGLGGLINAADILNGGTLPYLTLSAVEVSGNAGSGVVNEGFTGLYAGSRITNNTNSTFNGGGVYTGNVGAGLGVSADSRIDHNTAVAGGGIFLGAGTVTLSSASSVSDNFPNNCAAEDPSKTIPKCIN